MGTVTYVAQAGDYLFEIAEEHGTTWQAIWNHPGNTEHRRRRARPTCSTRATFFRSRWRRPHPSSP
ncbi:MAG: LysM peptidoglycan-binding domain-containing protein, partial [Myxococcales bacterium]|nr:LysM peptidoglycan-binding domain-containing protein [Myxococcales bacterium]